MVNVLTTAWRLTKTVDYNCNKRIFKFTVTDLNDLFHNVGVEITDTIDNQRERVCSMH